MKAELNIAIWDKLSKVKEKLKFMLQVNTLALVCVLVANFVPQFYLFGEVFMVMGVIINILLLTTLNKKLKKEEADGRIDNKQQVEEK